MLSMIHGEVVMEHSWISSQEFTDIVAISQMTPGPIGINAATYVGYTAVQNAGYSSWLHGFLGSLLTTFALVLPSLILMLIISMYFLKYRKHPMVEAVLKGIRPAIIGLIAAASLLLMNAENFGSPQTNLLEFIVSIVIFASALIANKVFKVNPIIIVSFMAVAGMVIYQ